MTYNTNTPSQPTIPYREELQNILSLALQFSQFPKNEIETKKKWIDIATQGLEQFYLRQKELKKNDYWLYSDLNFTERLFCPFINFLNEETIEKVIKKYQGELSGNLSSEFSRKYQLLFINGTWINNHSQFCQKSDLEQLGISIKTEPNILSSPDMTNCPIPEIFINLNHACTTNRYKFTVKENCQIEKPLLVWWISDTHDQHSLSHSLSSISQKKLDSNKTNPDFIISPQVTLELQPNASLKWIDIYQSHQSSFFHNALTNISLDKKSKFIQLTIQDENLYANHINTTQVALSEQALYDSYVIQQGSHSSSIIRKVDFTKPEGKANLQGLYLPNSNQTMDNLIDINHAIRSCESSQIYKGVLRENAISGFTGKVTVARDAQHTLSDQLNNTIILGKQALMQSRPQLEILADDVKCNHGSTIGQTNKEQIFYLMSRGIPYQQAQEILAQAFLREFYEKVEEHIPEIKHYSNRFVSSTQTTDIN